MVCGRNFDTSSGKQSLGLCKAVRFEKDSKTKDWNAFNGTLLDETFCALGIVSLLPGGVEAGACLYETARDAVAKGYQVTTCGVLTAGYGKRYSGPNRFDLWHSIGVNYVEHVSAAHSLLHEDP